jgi:DsbC/DsbD-like thiol-disulfide interchange protein
VPHTSSVKVYDGVTGAYLSDFVTAGSGGLNTPILMTFTETDPVTLAYTGGASMASSNTAEPVNDVVITDQVQPLLCEAILRWHQQLVVSFRTVNGTSTTGDNDDVAKSGTLTCAPGETTKTITIEVKGDSKREETFYLDLFGNSSNALFTKNRGVGTVLNDD